MTFPATHATSGNAPTTTWRWSVIALVCVILVSVFAGFYASKGEANAAVFAGHWPLSLGVLVLILLPNFLELLPLPPVAHMMLGVFGSLWRLLLAGVLILTLAAAHPTGVIAVTAALTSVVANLVLRIIALRSSTCEPTRA